ncbi:hypothetical protein C8R45DRAFT_929002 [Mycena sanguinolenta]|nr:hypothetical protein C8R45DRAFT_929002 [Mycena sanguinolenta]
MAELTSTNVICQTFSKHFNQTAVYTTAPASASASAISSPMPRCAPVTSATRLASENIASAERVGEAPASAASTPGRGCMCMWNASATEEVLCGVVTNGNGGLPTIPVFTGVTVLLTGSRPVLSAPRREKLTRRIRDGKNAVRPVKERPLTAVDGNTRGACKRPIGIVRYRLMVASTLRSMVSDSFRWNPQETTGLAESHWMPLASAGCFLW